MHANHITDKGRRKELSCNLTSLVFKGAFALSKALKSNEGLKAFDITANDISDEGAAELDSVVESSNGELRSLSGAERMQQFESVCIIA